MLEGQKTILEFDAWMAAFIPGNYSKGKANIFCDTPHFERESEMYKWHINKLNQGRFGDQWIFVGNPNKSDPNASTKEVIDCGMYPAASVPLMGGKIRARINENAPSPHGPQKKSNSRGGKANATNNGSDKTADKDKSYQRRRVNLSRIDLPIKFKVDHTELDPFDDNETDDESTAIECLGQILSYAEHVLMHQHRQFLFMIILLGHYVRIVRFDRSSVFATEKFNYKMHGERLTTFFDRYSRLSDADRGYDTTARRLEPGSDLCKKMRELSEQAAKVDSSDHVQQLFSKSLDDKYPWWELEVHVAKAHPSGESSGSSPPRTNGEKNDSSQHVVEVRRFLVGKPHFYAPGVVGRATRGYIAVGVDEAGELIDFKKRRLFNENGKLDCASWEEALKDKTKRAVSLCFVYLKDAWRVDHDGIEQEGSVLELLNGRNVPFVPRLVCHGDIPGQVTAGQETWKRLNKTEDVSECPMKRHQHYRLVVEQVGKPLDEFENGFRLVLALCCAFQAHMAAYTELGIIHRDISSGNILLYKNENGLWEGLLNDWELSKKQVDGAEAGARQPDRTGTWQFMSVHALNDPRREIVLADEIESILHVLLYYAVRFLPHNINPEMVPCFLLDYFDGFVKHAVGYRCGTAKASAMKHGGIDLDSYNLKTSTLEFFRTHVDPKNPQAVRYRHPISDIVDTVLSWLKAYYNRALDDGELAPSAKINPGTAKINPDTVKKRRLQFAFLMKMKMRVNVPPENSSMNIQPVPQPMPAASGSVAPSVHLAKKLESHDALYALFTSYLRNADWPAHDKGDNLQPMGGASARHGQGSRAIGKRPRADEGELVSGPSSKKLRW